MIKIVIFNSIEMFFLKYTPTLKIPYPWQFKNKKMLTVFFLSLSDFQITLNCLLYLCKIFTYCYQLVNVCSHHRCKQVRFCLGVMASRTKLPRCFLVWFLWPFYQIVLLLGSLWLSNHWSFKVNQLIRMIT